VAARARDHDGSSSINKRPTISSMAGRSDFHSHAAPTDFAVNGAAKQEESKGARAL
jgi:hypothetical protein